MASLMTSLTASLMTSLMTSLITCRYTRLLGEKQEVERHLLDAEHERLKVAKALVDLQVSLVHDL